MLKVAIHNSQQKKAVTSGGNIENAINVPFEMPDDVPEVKDNDSDWVELSSIDEPDIGSEETEIQATQPNGKEESFKVQMNGDVKNIENLYDAASVSGSEANLEIRPRTGTLDQTSGIRPAVAEENFYKVFASSKNVNATKKQQRVVKFQNIEVDDDKADELEVSSISADEDVVHRFDYADDIEDVIADDDWDKDDSDDLDLQKDFQSRRVKRIRHRIPKRMKGINSGSSSRGNNVDQLQSITMELQGGFSADTTMEDNQIKNPAASRKSVVVSMVINQPEKKSKESSKKRDDHGESKKSISVAMATTLLSTIYAILLVLFGIMFPVSEALQDYWLESYYNGVFLVYLYTVGTGFLLFLQFYTIPATHKRRKKVLEEEMKLQREQRRRKASTMFGNGNVSQTLDPSAMYNGLEKRHRHYSSASNSSMVLTEEDSTNVNHTWVNLEGLKEMFSHEGSSFYLRLGALVFGIGNLIYIGLEIDYYLIDLPEECPTVKFGWTFVLRLLFTVVQTFLLFKNSKLEVEVNMNITRWGFMHVIATNLCIWIRTLIAEIMHASHHTDDSHGPPTTGEYNSTPAAYAGDDICSAERELLDLSSPYLFPFVLEYSLIATGIFAIMASELRHSNYYSFMHNISHVMKKHNKQYDSNTKKGKLKDDDSDYESDTNSLNYAGPLHTHSTEISLKSSHKGMFLGVLLLAVILISMILFLFDENHDDFEQAQLNYLITDMCLHLAILVANLMAAYSLNKLSISLKPMSVDDIILLISMAGSVLFEISILVSTAYYLKHGLVTGEIKTYTVLAFCSAFVAAVQTLFQSIVVISGLRRYSMPHQTGNPGREAITFLIVANVTSWIYRTVQVKELELGIQEEFYGTLAWMFILNLNLPLLLFFRFHSSVCYADIWNVAYKSVDHTQAIISQTNEQVANPSSGFGSLPSPASSSSFTTMTEEEEAAHINPAFTLGEEAQKTTIHL